MTPRFSACSFMPSAMNCADGNLRGQDRHRLGRRREGRHRVEDDVGIGDVRLRAERRRREGAVVGLQLGDAHAALDHHLAVALGHAHRRQDRRGGVRALDQVDLVDGDQLLIEAARDLGLGLVVEQHVLDRPAEQAVPAVDLLDHDLGRRSCGSPPSGQGSPSATAFRPPAPACPTAPRAPIAGAASAAAPPIIPAKTRRRRHAPIPFDHRFLRLARCCACAVVRMLEYGRPAVNAFSKLSKVFEIRSLPAGNAEIALERRTVGQQRSARRLEHDAPAIEHDRAIGDRQDLVRRAARRRCPPSSPRRTAGAARAAAPRR